MLFGLLAFYFVLGVLHGYFSYRVDTTIDPDPDAPTDTSLHPFLFIATPFVLLSISGLMTWAYFYLKKVMQ